MEGFKGGGGEVRRVHILYVLSRNGAVEQPHLIRVHHLHRNGVYLRDVKRWLADLRGKDMPDSFSWSYKRRYKSGYVWQDLVDDELITPISDNEYVLKGSEISSKTDIPSDIFSSDEEQNHTPALETSPRPQHVEIDNNISSNPNQESSEALPPPPPPSLSSPDASDDSAKSASVINIDLWKKHPEQEEKDHKVKEECIPCKESTKNESHRKNKSHSKRTLWLFRNLFRCEGAETKDKALRMVQRQERYHTLSEGYYTRTALNDILRN